MTKATRKYPRTLLIDRVIRFFHPLPFPADLYSVEIPEGVEIRLGDRILKHGTRLINWLSCTPTGYTGTPGPMGVISQTILVHTNALAWSREQTDRVLHHEIVHTKQFARWGFWGTYWKYVVGLLKEGYIDCPVEKEAQNAVPPHQSQSAF
jgi:hypothetical protein